MKTIMLVVLTIIVMVLCCLRYGDDKRLDVLERGAAALTERITRDEASISSDSALVQKHLTWHRGRLSAENEKKNKKFLWIF